MFILEIAFILDFTPKIEYLNAEESRFLLNDRSIDIAMGPFTRETLQQFRLTIPYHYTVLVLRIPHGRSLTFIEKLYKPFDFPLWMSFFGLLALIFITVFITRTLLKPSMQKFILGSRTTTPFMNIVSLTLTGSISSSQMPRRNFARYIMALFLIYFMIVHSAYTGSLHGFVRRDVKAQTPQTIDEMIKQNYTFYVFEEEDIDFLSFWKKWKKLHERIRFFSESYYYEFLKAKLESHSSEKIAMPDSLEQLLFINNKYKKNLYNFCPQSIITYPRSIATQFSSPFANRISEALLRISENGFITKARQLHIPQSNYEETLQTKKLSLDMIFEIFYIVIGGWIIGYVVFLIESIYGACKSACFNRRR